jgi:hypothetical protein
VTTFPAEDGAPLLGVVGWVVEPDPLGAGTGAAHASDTPRTGSLIGRFNADTGVPGGTSTVNDNRAPPATVTVTVHCSADAVGNHVSAMPAISTAAAAPSRVRFARRKALAGDGLG